MMFRMGAIAGVLGFFACASTVFSQPAPEGEEDLASKVVDPSAVLTTITFQDQYIASFYDLDGDADEVTVQVVAPFKLGGKQNISRVRIPYTASSPVKPRGLADVALLDVVILPRSWGNLLAGGVASIGTNKGPGVDTLALGPTVGAVLKKGRWTYGFLNQNLFSGDDVATSQIQPILAYTFSKTVSVALGDLQYTYDWNEGEFVSVPLSFQVNYIARFGQQPVRFFANPQYNFRDLPGAAELSVVAGLAFIVR
jgi:hypothetical protein